jgi:hypothetical protein
MNQCFSRNKLVTILQNFLNWKIFIKRSFSFASISQFKSKLKFIIYGPRLNFPSRVENILTASLNLTSIFWKENSSWKKSVLENLILWNFYEKAWWSTETFMKICTQRLFTYHIFINVNLMHQIKRVYFSFRMAQPVFKFPSAFLSFFVNSICIQFKVQDFFVLRVSTLLSFLGVCRLSLRISRAGVHLSVWWGFNGF